MPQAGAIRAGRAYVELFAKDGRLVKGLQRASARLKAFAAGVTNIGMKAMLAGAAVTAPLLASVKAFASMGDKLDKMANRTGATVEALSELAYAAEQTGAGIDIFEKAVGAMQRSIRDAGQDLETKTLALKHLGLSYEALQGLSPDRQFMAIAEAISRVDDPTQRAAISMELFGRSGRQLMPMLLGGAKGIAALRDQAHKLGLTMSTEDAAAAAKLTDDMNSLWNVVKRGVFTIGSALAPLLDQLVNWLTPVVVQVGAWIRQNKGLVIALAAVGGGILAAGAAITVFGGILSGLGTVLGVVAVAFKVLAVAVGFLVSPIGMVMVALGALGAYLLYSTGAGGKALDWLGKKFTVLKEDAQTAFGGITDALAAGDIGLAAKILWLSLKLAWFQGIGWLKKLWHGFKRWFLVTGHEAFSGLLVIGEYIWHGLKVAWIELTSFLSQTWTRFTTAIHKAWNWVGNKLTKAWNKIKGLFSESFDAEAANRAADQAYEAGIRELEDKKQQEIAERERRRLDERQRAKAVHDATLRNIVDEHDAVEKSLDDEYDKKVRLAEEAVRQARDDLKAAAAEAKRKRTAKEREADEGPGKLEGPGSLDDIMSRIGAVATDFRKMTDKITVRGTFSAAAAFGLAAQSSATERTAKATEDTARNTKKINDEQKRGQRFA